MQFINKGVTYQVWYNEDKKANLLLRIAANGVEIVEVISRNAALAIQQSFDAGKDAKIAELKTALKITKEII